MNSLYNIFRQFVRTNQPIYGIDDTDVGENEQTRFIQSMLSISVQKFIYEPIMQEPFTETYFNFEIIRNRNYLMKTVYKVICKETKNIIMYFTDNNRFYEKKKIYDIYLNYNFRKYYKYLPTDIEKLIYSFHGEKFNKKHTNGIYIGSVVTDSTCNIFQLDVTKSVLLENYKFQNNNISIIQEYDKEFEWSKQIKKTFIEIKRMKLNKKEKTITGNIEYFVNQPPLWSPRLRVFVLNFNRIVREASCKNTIIRDLNNNRMALFGKQDCDTYTLDIKYPFSLIQGVVLTIACLNK